MIVASQKRPLGGRELHLPSISMLTSKTSTQKFFLRVLQVIIQLRDDTRRANKKAKQTGRLGRPLSQGPTLSRSGAEAQDASQWLEWNLYSISSSKGL